MVINNKHVGHFLWISPVISLLIFCWRHIIICGIAGHDFINGLSLVVLIISMIILIVGVIVFIVALCDDKIKFEIKIPWFRPPHDMTEEGAREFKEWLNEREL